MCGVLAGCGTPGAPQPPSLNLPTVVGDLSARRAGNQVALTWTMPKRNTDRTPINGEVVVRICRQEGGGVGCDAAGPEQMVAAGTSGSYTVTLPAEEATGAPRPISYFVELHNRKGRSAGLSNAAVVLAGEAPEQISELKAEVRKQGVVLSWAVDKESTAVRLERKLLSPAAKSEQGPLTPAPGPEDQNFLVDVADQGRAIDKTVRFGLRYEFRAQRVARVAVNGKTLELDGAFSSPVQVDVQDVFPPAVPAGLVAVASSGENGSAPAVDLSWQPDADADLAGYIVYRSEKGGAWQRVSAGAPGLEPAFHDAQVQAGHSYSYVVTAVDKSGHESARSAEAQETVPQP
jgi:hypothetical protein